MTSADGSLNDRLLLNLKHLVHFQYMKVDTFMPRLQHDKKLPCSDQFVAYFPALHRKHKSMFSCFKDSNIFYFQLVSPEDLSHLPMEHRGGDVLLEESNGPVAQAQRSPFGGFGANKRQTQVI